MNEGLDYLEIDPQLCSSLGFAEDETVSSLLRPRYLPDCR